MKRLLLFVGGWVAGLVTAYYAAWALFWRRLTKGSR